MSHAVQEARAAAEAHPEHLGGNFVNRAACNAASAAQADPRRPPRHPILVGWNAIQRLYGVCERTGASGRFQIATLIGGATRGQDGRTARAAANPDDRLH